MVVDPSPPPCLFPKHVLHQEKFEGGRVDEQPLAPELPQVGRLVDRLALGLRGMDLVGWGAYVCVCVGRHVHTHIWIDMILIGSHTHIYGPYARSSS